MRSMAGLAGDFEIPSSLAESVADHLGRAIAKGWLLPGQRLVEAQLCQEFGVSRTPLREAFRILSAEGLVDLSSRKGARVAELTESSVADVFTVRMALERLAARLAAAKAAVGDVEDLFQLNAEMKMAVESGDAHRFFDLNNRFHGQIASITQNDYLASLQLTSAARSFRPLFLSLSGSGHLLDSIVDHSRILEALAAGDGQLAEQCMEEHIFNAQREALRLVRTFLVHGETGPLHGGRG